MKWGDEGKGKLVDIFANLVDILANHFDIVARCQNMDFPLESETSVQLRMGASDVGEELGGHNEKIFVTIRLRPLNRKEIARNDVSEAFEVAVAHTIGHVAATVSMSKVAVSFTHIIKSGEPAFSVLVSRFILGETFPMPVYLSLLPIIGGCGLAALTELNFNMIDIVSNIGTDVKH